MSKRFEAGLPRDMFKSKKSKAKSVEAPAEEKNENKIPDAPNYKFLNLTMVYDEGRKAILGTDNIRYYTIFNAAEVKEGEVWECNIMQAYGVHENVAYVVNKIKDASLETKAEIVVKEPSAPAKKQKKVEVPSEDISAIKSELREKTKKLREANLKAGRMQRQINSIPGLKDEIEKKRLCIQSLKVQVKQLEDKQPEKELQNLTAERDHYKSESEKQALEIERLKKVLALYETGTKTTSVTTYLTGATGIHCNYLVDEGYKVYFSPGKRTLRFIPDAEGSVLCRDKDVSLPAIGRYSNFTEIRKLEARKEDNEVVVSLE